MRPLRPSRAIAPARAVVFAVAIVAAASAALRSPALAKAADTHGEATALYNEGTASLQRGDVGPAVLLLSAAARLEPRAVDVRVNLEHALRASAQARGEDATDESGFRWPLAADEAWWLAGGLLAAAMLLALSGSRLRIPSIAVLAVGVSLSAGLHVMEWREAHRPEAVVITRTLSVEHGPEEAVRPTIVLGEGERVHLGRTSGTRVEVWIGGAPVGWAARDGLWRVADAARYTSRLK